jgi:hypothetical protein
MFSCIKGFTKIKTGKVEETEMTDGGVGEGAKG